jgi:hypothetical protein
LSPTLVRPALVGKIGCIKLRHIKKAFTYALFLTLWNLAVSIISVKDEVTVDAYEYMHSYPNITMPLTGIVTFGTTYRRGLLKLLILQKWAMPEPQRVG